MRKKRVKKGWHRPLVMPEVSLTPLIDTALTLLVIFMITAPMVQYSIKVDLPQGSSKEVSAEQEFVVTLTKEDKLYFNSYPVDRSSLSKLVQEATKKRDDLPVYVRADETVSYGKVIEIVDQLKQAGIKLVAMSTRNIK